MQQRASPPPPRATEPPKSQSPQAVHPPPLPMPVPPQLPWAARLPPRPSPRAGADAIACRGHQGAGVDVHSEDHSFTTAALDVAAETSAPVGTTTTTAQKISSSATKRKESGVKQRKEQAAKRFKSPSGPVLPSSPLVPARSTGIRMMLSPRISPRLHSPATTTSLAAIDVSSSNDIVDVSDNENDETEKAAIARATKRFRSRCWNEFEPILENGVVVQARCKHCDELMSAKRGQGTSALLTHLKRCQKRSSALKIVQDLSSTLRSPSGRSLKDWRYDPDVSRYELIRMISLHGVPFLFMEYDGFRRFVSSLNPLFKVPCRTTVRNGCMNEFQEMKIELKDILKNINCRFSLTTDMWTSNQTIAYMVVTCRFIDSSWKLHKRIIQFIDVKTAHSGVELFNHILNCIKSWSIEHKLFGITLDNASSNNSMMDLLKKHLVQQNLIPVEGELLHHRCAGHVINLIVKDGLKFVESIVDNIRESIKYLRSSTSRKQMFREIIA